MFSQINLVSFCHEHLVLSNLKAPFGVDGSVTKGTAGKFQFNSFPFRGINIWKSLPSELKTNLVQNNFTTLETTLKC